MVIPMGPGNTEKQLQMMMDMESTVLCSTSSYALLLAEEIGKRGIRDKIHLKKGVIAVSYTHLTAPCSPRAQQIF